jgi:hypothetical protein
MPAISRRPAKRRRRSSFGIQDRILKGCQRSIPPIEITPNVDEARLRNASLASRRDADDSRALNPAVVAALDHRLIATKPSAWNTDQWMRISDALPRKTS